MSRIMAIDLASSGVRVNAVAPGVVQSGISRDTIPEATRPMWLDRIPLHRFAAGEEIAAGVAFLCSDESSYVTGQVLAIDGGFTVAGMLPATRTDNP